MNQALSLLNTIAVSYFGCILAASFCGALYDKKNKFIFFVSMLLMPLLQGMVYLFSNPQFVRQVYPFTVHLPLFLLLYYLTGQLLWPFFSVLCAYLCCQLRRWLALLLVALLSGGSTMQYAFELLFTIPLLLLLLHYASPVIYPLAGYPKKTQCLFGVIPLIYYIFDYLTCVYTDLLTSGNPVSVEFMPFVCCAAYLVFLLYNSVVEQTQGQLRQVQKSLDLQLNEASREITALRESQLLAGHYRHDMRHHLQYISACIENGQSAQAQTYISGICEEIEAQKVARYCENEAANLILSAFAGRAEKSAVSMKIRGALPARISVSERDLCVMLSNALENALHACQSIDSPDVPRVIDIQFYEKCGQLFLQIENPCSGDVPFEQGLPVSDRLGHGIGVQSICAIVGRYDGNYSFSVQNGRFILRLSVPIR